VKTVSNSSSVSDWCLPANSLRLANDETHVWRASLDESPSQIDNFRRTLASDEQTRALRFFFQIDRERFIVGRGILRVILGLYLSSAPELLSFLYNSYGKPAMAGESGRDAIHFNVSHSNGSALYAFTRGREVGVDLEHVRDDLEVDLIATQFFSPREIAALRALPAEQRKYGFFNCWTRKEAYIKAKGEGLSLPLEQFDVSLIPGEPAALLSTRPDLHEAQRWSLQELTFGTGYAAALAVAGRIGSLSCFQFRLS